MWRESTITPIHKKGDWQIPENYRGIAVGSVMCKVYCKILHTRLITFADQKQVPPVNQIGYKKNCRTSDHIFVLKTIIDKYIMSSVRKYLFVCFVDLKSAFDTIWRRAMIYKLLKIGIGGLFLNAIKDMYEKVYLRIKTDNGLTESFEAQIGVKQGCVLSPILFNLFLYDLPNIFTNNCDPVDLYDTSINCLLFADDMVLLSKSADGLQTCLNKLREYCSKWKLQVNLSKTKVIIFNKGGHKITKYTFLYNGMPLEVVQNYTYLGINFNASGTFKQALYCLNEKSKKCYYSLLKKLPNCPINLALKMFRIVVQPILSYGCEVWSPTIVASLNDDNFINICDKPDGEKTHLKFLKYMLGVHNKASNHGTRGELGDFPILLSQILLSIKYLISLSSSPTTSLAYKALMECKELQNSNSTNWLNGLHKVFTQCNETNQWTNIINGNAVNKKSVCCLIDRKMKSIYEQQWLTAINRTNTNGIDGNKLRTYCKFKTSFAMENYLLVSGNNNERAELCRLRISAHKLMIEVGRHTRPKVTAEKRYCKFCKDGSIEDEKHFIINCSIYENKRGEFFKEICHILPGISNISSDPNAFFNLILNCYHGDSEICGLVTKYVKKCMDIREREHVK
jgi:hypothetical protein